MYIFFTLKRMVDAQRFRCSIFRITNHETETRNKIGNRIKQFF